MKAQETRFLDILGRPNIQFTVPAFQRVYSWTTRECEELIGDMMRSGNANNSHFVGTFLYSVRDNKSNSDQSETIQRLQVIDGQQRITTVTLMLMAFVEYLKTHEKEETDQKENTDRAQQITEKFLLCDNGAKPKLQLTSIDGDMLAYLLGLMPEPEDTAARLAENLDIFRKIMVRSDFDADAFWRGCELLQVIAIELSGKDLPQEVFESLNSKGKRLAVEDLIRNSILNVTSDNEDALAIYENIWVPLEEKVEAANIDMEDMLCSWIASKHKDVYLDSKSEVFPLFKDDLMKKYKGNCKRLLADMAPYADMFVSNEQWRRDRMSELDRWLQGKPRNIISERKLFGD